jgi:ABC-type spermidine/putrescine transport system permease subunit I
VPGMAWLAAFFLVAFYTIVAVGFGNITDVYEPVPHWNPLDWNVGYILQALEDVIPGGRTWDVFVRTLLYVTVAVALSLAIGYPVAYWISRYGGRHKVLLLILVMLPFWTSYLIRTYSWTILLRDNGVVNSLLQASGIIDQPIILMNTELAVILGMVYGFLPFAILPLFVSIDRLDPNLVAAGRDLYASGRAAFRHVTLPLTLPGIVAAALLTFIPALGDFVTPDLLGGPQTTTIAKNVQELFLAGRDWPYGASLGFILMAVTLIGTLVALRTLRREVVGGE